MILRVACCAAGLALSLILGLDWRHGDGALWRNIAADRFVQVATASTLWWYVAWESRRPWRYASMLVAILGVYLLLQTATPVVSTDPTLVIAGWLGAVGATGILVRTLAARARNRGLWIHRSWTASLLPLCVALTPIGLEFSHQLGSVLDMYILSFEDALGARFSEIAVGLFRSSPGFEMTALAAYILLPAGIVAAHLATIRKDLPLNLLVAFLALTVFGYCLYWTFPVVGPRHVFGPWPYRFPAPGSFEPEPTMLSQAVPRNCMPSLHAAWAMLIWFSAAYAGPKCRIALRSFAGLNLLATLADLPSHWLTDLIVAVPFTVGVCALVMWRRPMRGVRLLTAILGGITTAIAMVTLVVGAHWFRASPGLAFVFVFMCIVPPLWLSRRLWRDPCSVSSATRRDPLQSDRL